MKINRIILVVLAFVGLQFGCTNSDLDVQSKNDKNNKSSRTNTAYQCGSYLSGNHSGSGYYNYGNYTIDLSGVKVGTSVTITCTNYDVPNRFNIQSANGGSIISTGWFGVSNSSGPWGGPINNAGSRTLTITKQSSSDNTYNFSVETVVPSNMNDAWEASISCSLIQNGVPCCYLITCE